MTVPTEHTESDPVVRIFDWMKKNQRIVIVVVVLIVGTVLAALYLRAASERRENFANTLLANARVASGGNVALAIADLADLAASHRGTIAAEEAEILLGQLRLSEGQAEAAVQSLQEYLGRGPSDQFRSPAYGLLAVALEQTSNFDEAAAAYQNAADAAWYDFLQAEYLLEAARVHTTIGDTAVAVTIYERILTDLSETDMVMEARQRLGELVRSDIDSH